MSNSPTNPNATQARDPSTFRLSANSIVPVIRADSPLGAGGGRRIEVSTLLADTMMDTAIAELRIAGVPESATSGLSIETFVASFDRDRDNLFSDADVEALGAKIDRHSTRLVSAWKRSHPSQPRLTAATIGAQVRGPAPSSEASSAIGSGAMVRASAASAKSTASAGPGGGQDPTSRKRSANDAFADAVALGEKELDDEDAPLDVRMFLPDFGELALAVDAITHVVDDFAAVMLSLPEDFSSCSPEQLRSPQFLADFGGHGDPDEILKCLRGVCAVIPAMHAALLRLRATRKRAWDVYILGTQTDGASWMTVKQLKFRESWDRKRRRMNPADHKSIDRWEDKVAEALRRCKQDGALSKDGALVGPVCPWVAAQLRRGLQGAAGTPRRPRGGKDNNGGQRAPKPPKAPAATGGKGKGGKSGKKKKKPAAAAAAGGGAAAPP